MTSCKIIYKYGDVEEGEAALLSQVINFMRIIKFYLIHNVKLFIAAVKLTTNSKAKM